jgi:tight adherence protein B
MQENLVILAGFASATLAVLALVYLCSDILLARWAQVRVRLDEEFGGPAQESSNLQLFKDLPPLEPAAEGSRSRRWVRFTRYVQQSGSRVPPIRLVWLSALSALGLGAAAAIAGAPWWQALLATAVGAAPPLAVVAHWRNKRMERLRAQLPDAFHLMSQAIRAGRTATAAVQFVADHCEAPLAQEFAHCCEQLNLGLSQEVALRELAERTGVMELRMFVVTMLVQRQSGGSPIEVLNNLGAVVGKRIKLQGKIKALTAEGRMQALVLLLLPPILLGGLYFLNRSHVETLCERRELLGAMALSEAVGAFFIRRITNIDY